MQAYIPYGGGGRVVNTSQEIGEHVTRIIVYKTRIQNLNL